MNDTINTFKDFWDYFKKKKSYEILLRTIPFYLVVGLILTVMIVYATISLGNSFDFSSVPDFATATEEQLVTYIGELSPGFLMSAMVYVALIAVVLILLSIGIQNSIYNSTKSHIQGEELPTVGKTFSNALKGYGRFLGYQFLYAFLPLMAVSILLYITGLAQYSFIITIVSTMLAFFCYSKLLRIENGDYLVPLLISVISIILSFMITSTSGILMYVIYLISMLFGLFSPMIMIFSLLKENDFREGIRYE